MRGSESCREAMSSNSGENSVSARSFQRVVLVHYHEIGLKGKNRSRFEERLRKNLEDLCQGFPLVTIHRIAGRLIVFFKEGTDREETLRCARFIATVPGVARVSCGLKCPRDLELMTACAIEAVAEAGDAQSFKVAARRNHTDFPIHSMEMNQLIGASLCEAFPALKVRMKDPDLTVGVEVVQNASYVYCMSIRGVGGLPVGSSGTLMALLSSGIDSPVALWRCARRGAVCHAVHFSGRPQTSDASEYLVEDIARVLEQSGCIASVSVVPFGDYQREIALTCPPSLRIILYRRMMLRIAERLAGRVGARALVTGESLGQVASQTLENICVTDDAVRMPVFRPLIGNDKLEIIDEAKRIGTFEISSQDAPDCCTLFMPRTPATHARLEAVREAEAAFPVDRWIEEICAAAEVHEYRHPALARS